MTDLEQEISQEERILKSILSPYGRFFTANIGYHWKEISTGKYFDKGIIFDKFKKFPLILQKLTDGTFDEFIRMKK